MVREMAETMTTKPDGKFGALKTGRSGQGRFLETRWTELFIEGIQGFIKKAGRLF
jgi:hypothetical protein